MYNIGKYKFFYKEIFRKEVILGFESWIWLKCNLWVGYYFLYMLIWYF